MDKSRSRNKTKTEIDKLRLDHESEEHWRLRREFLLKNHEDFPMDKLICLSQTYINIRVLGCRYHDQVMTRIAELSKGLSEDWSGGWQNRRLIQTGTRGIKEAEVPVLHESPHLEEEQDETPDLPKKKINIEKNAKLGVPNEFDDYCAECIGPNKEEKVEKASEKENIKPSDKSGEETEKLPEAKAKKSKTGSGKKEIYKAKVKKEKSEKKKEKMAKKSNDAEKSVSTYSSQTEDAAGSSDVKGKKEKKKLDKKSLKKEEKVAEKNDLVEKFASTDKSQTEDATGSSLVKEKKGKKKLEVPDVSEKTSKKKKEKTKTSVDKEQKKDAVKVEGMPNTSKSEVKAKKEKKKKDAGEKGTMPKEKVGKSSTPKTKHVTSKTEAKLEKKQKRSTVAEQLETQLAKANKDKMDNKEE